MTPLFLSLFTSTARLRRIVCALFIVIIGISDTTVVYGASLKVPSCEKLFTQDHVQCAQGDVLYSDDSCTEDSGSGGGGSSSTPTSGSSVPGDPDGWTFPTAPGTPISSEYAEDRGYKHRGVDLAGPAGTPIYAARDGVVTRAGSAQGFGNWIVIQHDENGQRVDSVYGHMTAASITVKPGDTVKAGQQIATIGSEGQSSGPHLHYEEWAGGRDGGQERKPVAVYGGEAVVPSQPSSPANQVADTGTEDSSEQTTENCEGESSGGAGGGATCQDAQPGGDNAKIIWDHLISKGLTKEQAAGVLGNLRQESGPNLDPSINEAVPSHAGAGFGIAQWTGGRRTAIENAAKARGANVNDLCFQLDYLVEESMSRESRDYPNTSEWDGLKRQRTVEEATDYWHHNFERSNDSNTRQRQIYAREYLRKYGG